MLVRLQKFLADAGVASRRASELIIVAGRVAVNGKTVQELGSRVDPVVDRVAVDGATVKPRRKLYLALNKPPDYVCSRRDPLDRPSVHDLLPREWRHLYTVGWLDYDSEGLIFLTNDGDFSLCLTHPRYGIRKKYWVTVEGRVELRMMTRLTGGVRDHDETLKAEKARLLKANSSHSLVELELSEGKNREVRRLFEAQGLKVERLQRIQIGPIKLGELPIGKWRILTPAEVNSFASEGTKFSTAKTNARSASSLRPGSRPALTGAAIQP